MIDATVAKRIRLVGIDVDGTLTDGGLYIGASPKENGQAIELKRFDILDGVGIKLLLGTGMTVAIVTGRSGDAAKIRAQELGVQEFVVTGGHKLPPWEKILAKYGVAPEDACFVGDDIPDLPIMQRVGLAVAVANAVAEVKAVAQHTTTLQGGHGAVREFVETFLAARGTWQAILADYLEGRGGHSG